jgi:phospholipase C
MLRPPHILFCLCGTILLLTGCSSSGHPAAGGDAGCRSDAGATDAGDASPGPPTIPPASCDGGMCIQHLVVIVQENHTFDTHFGGYCTATPGSNPTCTAGPGCCEAIPATDPSGTAPTLITDTVHATFDPNHTAACETIEIDDGKMDGFVTGDGGANCAAANNVALADPAIVKPYWDLAHESALADRYFQPVIGESSSNDMFFARASYLFNDNDFSPPGAVGTGCDVEATPKQFMGPTIGDLLTAAAVSWTWFSDGYDAMVAAAPGCPDKPLDCAFALPFYPCAFDPSDDPFEFFASTVDRPNVIKDYAAFTSALAAGTLPAVSFIKAIGYKQEHPGFSSKLSPGVAFAAGVIASVEESPYGGTTLVLLTYDEGGGYFDHVAPPPPNTFDNRPYGTRVPLLAVGPFAKKNFVSHVVMEHSSIVKFIEWNWLGQTTGQLGTRDTVVNNIGSLLDPTKTGTPVPAQ